MTAAAATARSAPDTENYSVPVKVAHESSNGIPPPHSIEAEQGVLGSMLISPADAIAACIEKITSGHFYDPRHRMIFEVVIELYKSGEAIDLITVTQALRDRNLLAAVGGASYVTSLFTFVPTAANVAYYVDIVGDQKRLRDGMQIGAQLANGKIDTTSAAEKLQRIEGLRADSFTIRDAGEILAQPRNEHSCLLGDRLLALAQSLVIAGVGGIGKTRLLLQLLVAVIIGRPWCGIETHGRGMRCLFLQTENSTVRLQDDLMRLREWAGEDWSRAKENLLIHTIETDSDALIAMADPESANRLQAVIRRYNPDIVGIDPLRDFAIGDLNSDADMAQTLRGLGRIYRAGNPERALVILHHALTGRAGAAKAFGLERAGFARNSKMLQTWARGLVNVVPGAEDNNETLVLTCGKNSNGKEFEPIAVRLNPDTMIYEVAPDFDVHSWREHVSNASSRRRSLSPRLICELRWTQPEMEKKSLVKLITEDTGCGRSRAYQLIDEAKQGGILRFNKTTQTYAKT